MPTHIDTIGHHSVGPWPAGFRGIGGHLIRPRAGPAPSAPPTTSGIASHGAHLLSPIVASADGSRASSCPVCVATVPLPPAGGWVHVRCSACGTEFVATDGTPPPLPPPLPPVRPSPLAPPLDSWEPLPAAARGFTSDVRTDDTGRLVVRCPQCLGADVFVPPDAVVLRCPACHAPFMVNLGAESLPGPAPSSPPPSSPVYDPDAKLWSPCPNCGLTALMHRRVGRADVLSCAVCNQQVIVSEGPCPPRLAPLPAPPTVWERVRRWLRRR